jgi:hypothetical protein
MGVCLRFFLYSQKDFEFFHKAATRDLQSVTWLNGSPEDEGDLQDADVDEPA